MPAEWEPHQATWITWPRPESDSFPGEHYEPAARTLGRLVAEIARGEEVHLNCWDEAAAEEAHGFARAAGARMDRVYTHVFPAYEPWCRDHGPIFVVHDGPPRRRAVLDWGYNAWGGKYPPWDLDDAIPQRIAAFRGLPVWSPGLILEGGSIDGDGRGTLLTTESCLLNPNRNRGLGREAIERALRSWLGVERICWLGEGIVGDDTDGHVDDITRFVAPGVVATAVEPDPADPNHAPLAENLARLRAWRDERGRPFRIVEIPMPGPVAQEGVRLPASYLNFYIANAAVIVPVYGHPNDRIALAALREVVRDRPVVGLDARDLIWGLGAFHCMTQQEPV
ncbi:MAG: agmatine deiminase family protein [Verrucomicrobia bacterium]|nr:MAG: agmatine deiminase family protein [Verrucomicrobiota bacterium]